MARDPKVTRKAYEYKLGKDLASKLDDKQIHLLSEYYNSLSDKETSEIDSKIVQGRNNTELHEMAIGMVEENESRKTPPKPKATPKPKAKPKAKAKPKKAYDEDRSVAYKLPDHILKDLDEDQIKDLSAVYNMMSADEKKEFGKGTGDLMDLARQMSDPLQEKYNTGGLDSWTGKPKDNSNAMQGPRPMPSAKKKPDKKAVTALVKMFSAEKKEDTKQPDNETIDPEVLKMLGLEDVSDFDYDEYKTLLKEKMLANQMVGGKGDNDLLKNEFKRVRSKTGRFKSKKKTVNISKVVQSGKKYNKSAVNTQKLLSGSKEAESTKVQVKGEAVTNSFENINQSLLGIDSLLKGILGEEKKESEQEAKTARKSAQKAEEEKSEKSAKTKATKALKGFKAPKMGFLDMIKNFFKNILLGGFILKALDWFQNEDNQKKIQNVITFITDNLDKILLGIAALVGIGIGAQILGFLSLFSPLVGGLAFLLKGLLVTLMALPKLILGAIAAAAKGAIGLLGGAAKMLGGAAVLGPIALGALGIAGTLLAMKGVHDVVRNRVTGGADFTAAHQVLDKKLVDAGMTTTGLVYTGTAEQIRAGKGTKRKRTKEEEALFQEVQGKRKELNNLRDSRDENKNVIEKKKETDIGALMEDKQYYTERRQNQRGPRGSKVIKSLNEEGRAKKEEIEKKARADKLREDLLARMKTVDFRNQPLVEKMEELSIGETQKQYFRWLSLTYGGRANEDSIISDPKNIEKFTKDTGLGDPTVRGEVTPTKVVEPTIPLVTTETEASDTTSTPNIEPKTELIPVKQTPNNSTATAASKLTESHEGTGKVSSPMQKKTVPLSQVPKEGSSKEVMDAYFKALDAGELTSFNMPNKPKVPAPPNTDQASAVLPLGGGGSGGDEIASASGGRAAAASFSSIDGNNPNPTQVGAIFNLTAVG
tara:strand:- start:1766 stop:4561 length:2796 start_codon:yes stop_codon:yes gene_type:complete